MCEHCGKEDRVCEVIGIFPREFVAQIDGHVLCPMCDGRGSVKMETWKFPKPCPVCHGCGQMDRFSIPTKEKMIEMVMAITPARDRKEFGY